MEQSLYFLMIALGFSAGIFFIFRTADPDFFRFSDLTVLVLPSIPIAWVGARMAHVFFEAPALYQAQPWRVLALWEGGFVFYGGVISVALWALVVCSLRNMSPFRVGDLSAPWVELGYAMGRLGCFFAGCCFGRVCILPIGQSWFCPTGLYPTQLLASGLSFLLFAFLILARRLTIAPGRVFAFWLMGHGLNRLMMEHYRGDFRGPLIADLTLGVWVSWALVALGLSLFLVTRPEAPPEKS